MEPDGRGTNNATKKKQARSVFQMFHTTIKKSFYCFRDPFFNVRNIFIVDSIVLIVYAAIKKYSIGGNSKKFDYKF